MVLFKSEKDSLTAYIGGDIDHHTSVQIRQTIDSEISRLMPSVLRLDFRDVNFMDSSGVGLVMGRYKTALVYGCEVIVTAMPPKVEKIMKMSGLGKIITFEKE